MKTVLKRVSACLFVLILVLLSDCGEDVTYQLNEDGTCRITVSAENAANYEWVPGFSVEGVAEITGSDVASSGLDFTGYSSSYWCEFRGVSQGTTDVLLNYRQIYEGGSYSSITRLYELQVDADGRIFACTQYADTLGNGGNLYAYLKCNPGEGYNWNAVSWDEEILSVNRTGSEEDTDQRFPGNVWQVFHFAQKAEGDSVVVFELTDGDGNVTHTVAYLLHIVSGVTPTCVLIPPSQAQ